MHRFMAVKQREVQELNDKIVGLKLEVKAIKEEKALVEMELDALKEQRDFVQKQIASKLLDLDSLTHRIDEALPYSSTSASAHGNYDTGHKAFLCSASSLSDGSLVNSCHDDQGGGLSLFLSNPLYAEDHIPSVEAIEAAVLAANIQSENSAEGKAASEVLMIVYEEDYHMSHEFWTKLVKILAHHKLWSDIEMLIGLGKEQHFDFVPSVDVLDAMVLRAVHGGRNPERKLLKLKALLGNGCAVEALHHTSTGVKSAVRNLLLMARIKDDELYNWLASFTDYN